MPYKPNRPCACHGCGRLAVSGQQYCAAHQAQANKHYNQYERDPLSNKRYGRSWKRIRDRYIKAHPLCETCLQQDLLTSAAEVHHILPLRHGGTNDTSNLMSLCKPCHSRITAEMGDRWGYKNR